MQKDDTMCKENILSEYLQKFIVRQVVCTTLTSANGNRKLMSEWLCVCKVLAAATARSVGTLTCSSLGNGSKGYK